jgi:hypothetical protein
MRFALVAPLALVLAVVLVAAPAAAQVKPDKQYPAGKPYDASAKEPKKQGQWSPKRDHWQASHATKEMLIKHGYKVVGVEQFPDGNVLYFRRDGAASVQQVGAIEKVVIRPGAESVSIEGAPREVLADVKLKLGM